MARFALTVLALALVAVLAVADAQTIALLSNNMTSPFVGTTASLGAGKGIVSERFPMSFCRDPVCGHTPLLCTMQQLFYHTHYDHAPAYKPLRAAPCGLQRHDNPKPVMHWKYGDIGIWGGSRLKMLRV